MGKTVQMMLVDEENNPCSPVAKGLDRTTSHTPTFTTNAAERNWTPLPTTSSVSANSIRASKPPGKCRDCSKVTHPGITTADAKNAIVLSDDDFAS